MRGVQVVPDRTNTKADPVWELSLFAPTTAVSPVTATEPPKLPITGFCALQAFEKIMEFDQLLDTKSVEVYGTPNDAVRQMMEQIGSQFAEGGMSLTFRSNPVGGFTHRVRTRNPSRARDAYMRPQARTLTLATMNSRRVLAYAVQPQNVSPIHDVGPWRQPLRTGGSTSGTIGDRTGGVQPGLALR